MPSLLESVVRELGREGVDLRALGLAWARTAPTIALVPAFGLRAIPAPGRLVFGLALAASIFPAIAPLDEAGREPWLLLLVGEVLRGVPIAIAAAVPLWAATMVGGIADVVRGSREETSSPVVEGRATPLGVLFSLFASFVFLAYGGPARVASALATRPLGGHPLLQAAQDISGGIRLAVAIGAPFLVAGIVLEIAFALIARSAAPAQIQGLLAPLRSFAVLVVMAVVLERVARAIALGVDAAP